MSETDIALAMLLSFGIGIVVAIIVFVSILDASEGD
jgi:uncharacterized protein (UPF0333 family)